MSEARKYLDGTPLCRTRFTGPDSYDRALALVNELVMARGAFCAFEPWPDGECAVYYREDNEKFVKEAKIPSGE